MSDLRRPKGTHDILPPESDVWRRAQRTFDNLCEVYGFGLTLTPLFEPTELFARGVGHDTEVVEKQMYTFRDQGERSLTLRPEATASVVRAAIQAGIGESILKGSYWGPMFRYERPQQGRSRQFYQGGVEYLGSGSPEADVEVIEFGYRYLEEMGVSDITVQLNSIGDPADRAQYRQEIQAFLRSRLSDLSPDAQRRVDTNPMRVLDSKADQHVIAAAPVPLHHLGPDAQAHMSAVKSGLEAVGVPYVINDKLVRGLDYYNRTVFEYSAGSYQAAQSAMGGGGRYDGLFEVLGGKPTPGVGLAMGVDRILLASSAGPPAAPLDVFVVVADADRRQDARLLVSTLRRSHVRTDMLDRQRSVKAQFKAADRSNSRFAVVVGEEWADGQATIRDLVNGEQQVIGVKEIAGWVQNP